MNVAPLGAGAYFLATDWDNECDEPITEWLLVSLVLFVFNILFGVYVLRTVTLREPDPEDHRTPFEKATAFVLYDPCVAIYIIISIFSVVWGFLGLGWLEEEADKCEKTDTELWKMSSAAALILILFIFIGVTLVFWLLCTSFEYVFCV
jgi:hypothetical protein